MEVRSHVTSGSQAREQRSQAQHPLRIADEVGDSACKALKALLLSSSPPTSVNKERALCCYPAGPQAGEWVLHIF